MRDPDRLAKAIDAMLMSGEVPDSTYLGGRVHDGKLSIEPSDNVQDLPEARETTARQKQIAIWDAAGGREIATGGTGGELITEHDITEQPVRTYTEGAH